MRSLRVAVDASVSNPSTASNAGEQPEAPAAVVAPPDENVFRTLARQARSRSRLQLWVITLGGAVDAAIFEWSHPALSWLAAGCVATAAYGVWGLLDRALADEPPPVPGAPGASIAGLRHLAAIVGTGAAVWAVLSFMATALGNWNH